VAFMIAASEGHASIVKLLLIDNRNPAANDDTAFRIAAANDHLSVVELLLCDHRIDPTANSNYAVVYASWVDINCVEKVTG
jgi:ankyrin repeat protein